MELSGSLSNQLLIAMPGMADPNFNSTVTLICEHNAEGALGVVVNRPMTLNLGGLFEQLDLADADQSIADYPVLSGGPVARERGFVLHKPAATYDSSIVVSPDIDIIFDVPFPDRWSVAAETIGIDISRISVHAGHA